MILMKCSKCDKNLEETDTDCYMDDEGNDAVYIHDNEYVCYSCYYD